MVQDKKPAERFGNLKIKPLPLSLFLKPFVAATVATNHQNWLACRNHSGDKANLAVNWGLWEALVLANQERKNINMESHLWTLLWITPVSGSLGGIINYYNLDEDLQNKATSTLPNEKRDWFYKLTRSIIIGIGAAFTVPLFLQTISSSLMTECKDKPQLFFVYASFCILASVFSRKFLDTVAEKALKTAQKADEKSTLALDKAEDLKPLQIKATEKDDDLNSEDEDLDESDMTHLEADMHEKVKVDINNIKKAFQKSKYAYRTSKGIARQIKSDEYVVVLILEKMEEAGLAKKIVNKDTNKVLWTLIK